MTRLLTIGAPSDHHAQSLLRQGPTRCRMARASSGMGVSSEIASWKQRTSTKHVLRWTALRREDWGEAPARRRWHILWIRRRSTLPSFSAIFFHQPEPRWHVWGRRTGGTGRRRNHGNQMSPLGSPRVMTKTPLASWVFQHQPRLHKDLVY